jgi:Uma2 family endonuclease
MASTPAARFEESFPNLRRDVVAGYLNAPENIVAQILDGDLFTHPRPATPHGRASSRIGGRLRPFDDPIGDDPGGWVILDEPELHLGPSPDILVPDLAGWRRPRMPEVPNTVAMVLPPDWVCEVLSLSTERIDRGRKMRIWRREGVGYVWLVSPEHKTLEGYHLENGRYSLLNTWEGDDVVRADPFEAVELPLKVLWEA